MSNDHDRQVSTSYNNACLRLELVRQQLCNAFYRAAPGLNNTNLCSQIQQESFIHDEVMRNYSTLTAVLQLVTCSYPIHVFIDKSDWNKVPHPLKRANSIYSVQLYTLAYMYANT
jgi:hypothetical protein